MSLFLSFVFFRNRVRSKHPLARSLDPLDYFDLGQTRSSSSPFLLLSPPGLFPPPPPPPSLHNSWVEHDPMEILSSVALCAGGALAAARAGSRSNLASSSSGGAKSSRPPRVVALGITNQRESTIAWDRATGAPLHRSIVWNDGRTAEICARVEKEHGGKVRFFSLCFLCLPFASEHFSFAQPVLNKKKRQLLSRTASAPSRASPSPLTSRPTRCSGSWKTCQP